MCWMSEKSSMQKREEYRNSQKRSEKRIKHLHIARISNPSRSALEREETHSNYFH